MRICALDPRFVHVAGDLARYRLHPMSMCTDRWKMWKGFHDAICIQQRLWGEDSDVAAALAAKKEQMNAIYGYGENPFRNALVRLSRNEAFIKHMPWKGRHALSRVLGIELDH